jgi:O-antigen ligase
LLLLLLLFILLLLLLFLLLLLLLLSLLFDLVLVFCLDGCFASKHQMVRAFWKMNEQFLCNLCLIL